MRKIKSICLLGMVMLTVGTLSLPAAELRVPGDFSTIQSAVDAAVKGDVVILAPGVYSGPGNRDINFGGRLITVRGIAPDDWSKIQSTVIDCQGSESELHRGFIFQTSEEPNAVVEGLTIINARGQDGGAILCRNASPAIRNCLLRNNKAVNGNGGAIACFNTANAIITNCIIRNNESDHTGGGICCIENSRVTIINCAIMDNVALTKGGGIYSRDNQSIIVANCTLMNNSAGFGGGIYGIGDLGTSAILVNTIIWNNQYPGLGGGHAWNDITVNHCVLQETWPGRGNIERDPMLDGEGHIASGSPCIDAGIYLPLYTLGHDIDFQPRSTGNRVDIGCDESGR